jgi:hypothetical protein
MKWQTKSARPRACAKVTALQRQNPSTSRSYLLAIEDTSFLLRDEMRAIRFALEFGKAELALRDWNIRSTIIVFGGARVPSPEQAAAAARTAHNTEKRQTAERFESPVQILRDCP